MKRMSLADLQRGKKYLITGYRETVSGYGDKLFKMGFVEGTPVQLAPVALKDPVVVEVRGSRIALRKNEAQLVYVKEVSDA
ncbi:FeoA family protein [Desulfopila sp. IMCC35008]|uniref:FeoA family protein n=1 Tax=Desulfopila sp. IMCC35008 TaxID=2653858 RepID=UPI001F10CA46|nr:FeoA family protein [Desulfopila sp. IMCC35008]